MKNALDIAIDALKNIYVAAQDSGSKIDTAYLINYIQIALQQIEKQR